MRADTSPVIARLIDEIAIEIVRIWGDDEFEGMPEDYVWLLTHYGVTEDDDAEWIGIVEYYGDGLLPEDEFNEEWLQFLNNEQAVRAFLEQLLQKYWSHTITHQP